MLCFFECREFGVQVGVAKIRRLVRVLAAYGYPVPDLVSFVVLAMPRIINNDIIVFGYHIAQFFECVKNSSASGVFAQ